MGERIKGNNVNDQGQTPLTRTPLTRLVNILAVFGDNTYEQTSRKYFNN
jgi:hypothetical protein